MQVRPCPHWNGLPQFLFTHRDFPAANSHCGLVLCPVPQERVEVITPQLTSRDLQVGWERAPEPEGIGAGSIGQVRLSPERIPPFNADRPAFSVVLPLSGFVLGPSWVGQVAFCAPSPPL